MKGLTWKKIMSLVLAVALVIGAMQFNAKTVSAGTTASVSDVTVVTNTDDPSNPTVTYSLKGENGDPSIQGTYTDIVLAIDLSGSMDGQAVKDAKAAAKAFVDSLVGKDAEGNDVLTKTYVQIAIVKYSSTAEAVVLGTTGFGWNTQNIYFSNDKNTLDRAIDGLKAGGGTNYDAGMEAAETLFAGRNNAKAIVFMSDGEPTYANGSYSYDSTMNGKITVGDSWTKDATLDVYYGTAKINGQDYPVVRK
ncbi:MAG: VWA domain-containing protein, partial [Clostridia bacterium]|nr:VWA domain-containing protein [Clostridia bacterium]